MEKLLTIGFLTGSQAFGTAKEDSDYDVVYSIEDSYKINDIIEGIERTPSDYFSGYFIEDSGKIINLIPVHPHEYLPWFLATKAMTSCLRLSGITDSIKKNSVFMGIVSLFKGTIEPSGNLKGYKFLKNQIRKEINKEDK